MTMVWFMVFSTTFSNISVISWRSVLLGDRGGHRSTRRKDTDLSRVIDKLLFCSSQAQVGVKPKTKKLVSVASPLSSQQ